MWNASKSAILSSVCTKIVITLVLVFAFAAPSLVSSYLLYTSKSTELLLPLLITIYACTLPAMLALYSLDCMLANIKNDDVFIEKNVKYLRTISWCCFAVALILLVSGFYYVLFIMIAVTAAFFGLILRVVKNVIEKAMIIKNENDYTV